MSASSVMHTTSKVVARSAASASAVVVASRADAERAADHGQRDDRGEQPGEAGRHQARPWGSAGSGMSAGGQGGELLVGGRLDLHDAAGLAGHARLEQVAGGRPLPNERSRGWASNQRRTASAASASQW